MVGRGEKGGCKTLVWFPRGRGMQSKSHQEPSGCSVQRYMYIHVCILFFLRGIIFQNLSDYVQASATHNLKYHASCCRMQLWLGQFLQNLPQLPASFIIQKFNFSKEERTSQTGSLLGEEANQWERKRTYSGSKNAVVHLQSAIEQLSVWTVGEPIKDFNQKRCKIVFAFGEGPENYNTGDKLEGAGHIWMKKAKVIGQS